MVRISSATQPQDNIARYRPWFIERAGRTERLEVETLRPHGPGFVARITGVEDRDGAQALAGCEIAVPRAVLPALEVEGEYYWQDLMGLRVNDVQGRCFGTVAELVETGAHDVLIVRDGKRETLIPFVAAHVLEVDLAGRWIRVAWQEPA